MKYSSWLKNYIKFAKDFDENTALECAKQSQAIYKCKTSEECKLKIVKGYLGNNKGKPLYSIKLINDTIFIAFKGTTDLMNWYANAYILLKNVDDVRIHNGFFNLYKEYEPDILAFLKSKKFKKIILTGHSLGGALATVAAYELSKIHKVKFELFTFGSPQVGNIEFKKKLNGLLDRSWRFVNRNDIVTRSVEFARSDFYHVGKLILINSTGTSNVNAHGMHHYITGIENKKYDILQHNICRSRR